MKRILSLILILAITLGMALSLASCSGRGYFYSDGVSLDEGVVNYLCSYYKYYYMASLAGEGSNVEDTAKFWSTPYYGLSSTLGDYLKYYGEKYIVNLLAANELFDDYARLTYEDKVEIELAVNEIIEYYHGGSKKEFNKAAEKFGFNYKDMYRAVELMYKAYILERRVVAPMDKSGYYDEFFGEYKRVAFLFVSTEGLSKDEVSEIGGYETRIDELLDAVMDGGDGDELSSLMAELAEKYGEYTEHYLYAGSEFCYELGDKYPEATVAALGLEVGYAKYVDLTSEQSETEDDGEEKFTGVCFMYCLPNEDGKYLDSASEYFSDFEALCTSSYANVLVGEYKDSVKLGDKWESFDPSVIPFNGDYVPIFY